MRRIGLVIAMCVAFLGVNNLIGSRDRGKSFETRRGEFHVKENAVALAFLETHTQAGQEVFVYPYQPIFYFVEHLKNPTRYSYLLYGFNTEAQFREAAADLERKRVRYVVMDGVFSGQRIASVFPAYKQPEESRLIMEPYLKSHYQVVKEAGRFRILERIR